MAAELSLCPLLPVCQVPVPSGTSGTKSYQGTDESVFCCQDGKIRLIAVQGLATRVTKSSSDCDKALHRLICNNSTLDHKTKACSGTM